MQCMAAGDDLGQGRRVQQHGEHRLGFGRQQDLALRRQGLAGLAARGPGRRRAPGGRRIVHTQQVHHARGRQRQRDVGHAERVGHRVGDAGRRAHVVALAQSLGAQRRERAGSLQVHDDRVGHLAGGGHQVIGEGAGLEAAVAAISELLHQRRAESLGECAADLAVGQGRVQEGAGVVCGDVAVDADAAGGAIHLDGADVESEAVGRRRIDAVVLVRGGQLRR